MMTKAVAAAVTAPPPLLLRLRPLLLLMPEGQVHGPKPREDLGRRTPQLGPYVATKGLIDRHGGDSVS